MKQPLDVLPEQSRGLTRKSLLGVKIVASHDYTEEWRPIPGYEGVYEASSLGRVRSVDRVIVDKRGVTRKLKGKVLSPAGSKSGHLRVNFGKNFGSQSVHHLVLITFVGPRPEGMESLHKNGKPEDNRVTNLRWGTRSENLLDMVKHGGHFGRKKKTCPRGHNLDHPNLVPSTFKINGRRNCLACSRARAFARAKNRLDEVQEISDGYYREIMGQKVE